MRDRELQPTNMLLKLADEETEETFNAGTLDKELQLLNMPPIFVAAAVLNNGTVVKDLHPLNMPLIFVAAAVLNNGTVIKSEQF